MEAIRVLVVGAAGRMGREVVRAVCAQQDMKLVAAVDRNREGDDAGTVAGIEAQAVPISTSLSGAISAASPEVAVDFTLPDSVMSNVCASLESHVACVVGASGLTEGNLDKLASLCERHQTPVFVAPNFAIGAVLMMQFAAQAASHFDSAEIVELHHAGKVDAPSATARRTAQMMVEAPRSRLAATQPAGGQPARGLAHGSVRIHSVRLPGLMAHQEVILGGLGQTLTIRHDSASHESFMPGVLLAIRKVRGLRGLTVGLEKIL